MKRTNNELGMTPYPYHKLLRKSGTIKVFCGPFGWQYQQEPFDGPHPISWEIENERIYKKEMTKLFRVINKASNNWNTIKVVITRHPFFYIRDHLCNIQKN